MANEVGRIAASGDRAGGPSDPSRDASRPVGAHPLRVRIEPPRFTVEDVDVAYAEWGANCGPAALSAVTGLTLDEVRPHMRGFEGKGYTNPTLMFEALASVGCNWWRRSKIIWPQFGPDLGLVRIQWEGPWTEPGVPIRARYRHTHWIATGRRGDSVGVFDINALGNGSGWCTLADWAREIVPAILEYCVPRASGAWHATHVIEIGPCDRDGSGEAGETRSGSTRRATARAEGIARIQSP